MLGNAGGGVQRDRVPHDADGVRRNAALVQEVAGRVAAVDLEAIVVAAKAVVSRASALSGIAMGDHKDV
jgi:hypothetical protein